MMYPVTTQSILDVVLYAHRYHCLPSTNDLFALIFVVEGTLLVYFVKLMNESFT